MITGIVLRDLAHHFVPRRIEWLFAINAFALGVKLWFPPETFQSVPHVYDLMQALANETTWGATLTAIGLVRLLALILNGSVESFAPYSPLARAITSFFCAGVWLSLSVGYLIGNPAGLGMVYFGAAFVFEVTILLDVGHDAGMALTMAIKTGRSSPGKS